MNIKEIAQEAGVAMSTVSLVLNNKPGVRKETRARIAKSLVANGYVIRESAAPERGNGEIRFLRFIASNHVSERNHEFFTDLLNGAERYARSHGFEFSFVNVFAEEFGEAIRQLESRECLSGTLVLASELTWEGMGALLRCPGPIVLLDCPQDYCPLNCVNTDNVGGAFAAVMELYRQGHRKIGFLRGEVEIGGMYGRFEGYHKAMKHLGLSVNPDHVICVDTIVDVAAEQMLSHLRERDAMPTAFFACNDLIAAGAIRALLQAGYRVPEDISIIGFDDIQLCSLLTPPLSTMRIDRLRMGELGVERLLALQNGRDDRLRSLMPVKPVLRSSIAPPRESRDS